MGPLHVPLARMAVGKNKGLNKAGKKGAKKKVIDPFTRKDWYDVKSPALFTNRNVGKTLINRTQGTKIASEGLKGRVFEVSLADLQNETDAERSFRKFRLIAQDVQGKDVLTNFYGMDITTDKLRSMVKKWQSYIRAYSDVKTTDGYVLRIFSIGFTDRNLNQKRKTSYAQSQQIKKIRKKMVDIMNREVSNCEMKELVNKLIPDTIADDIKKASNSVYPLKDVYIRKVKVLQQPKFELGRLMELHSDAGKGSHTGTSCEDMGSKVERPDNYEPPVLASV